VTPEKETERQQAVPQGVKGALQPPASPGKSRVENGRPWEQRTPPTQRTKGRQPSTCTLGMHAAPLKYKPGMRRRWKEEDNKGVKIVGIRWLLKEV